MEGAERVYIEKETDHLQQGHFWCEFFTGRHLSIDYVDMKMVECVEGYRSPHEPMWKWNKWKKVNSCIPFPLILRGLQNKKHINCEFIDGKLIEVHQSVEYEGALELRPLVSTEELLD